MPSKVWRANSVDMIPQDNKSVVLNGIARLTPVDSDGEWSPYELLSESEIILRGIKANSITETFGFYSCHDENNGSVGFQLSLDDGDTWLCFNTASEEWEEEDEYNTWEEIDQGLKELHWGQTNKTISFKVLISPSDDGKKTPLLYSVVMYYESDHNFWEDFIRSTKRYMEGCYKAKLKQVFDLQAASTKVDLDLTVGSSPGFGKIVGSPKAFNLTGDSSRSTNIFQSISGSEVTLSSAQEGFVEVSYYYQPPIYITTDEYFFPSNPGPAIIIAANNNSVDYVNDVPEEVVEIDWYNKKARVRVGPTLERFTTLFICQDYRKIRTLAMGDGIDSIFRRSYQIESEATHTVFTVVSNPERTAQDIDRDNHKVVELTIVFSAMRWPTGKEAEYEEVNLAENICLKTHFNGGFSRKITITGED